MKPRCGCGDCPTCKSREKMRRWRAANRDRARASERARYAADPERHRAKAKRWRDANPEKVRASVHAWQARNPEKAKAINKAWIERNRERMRDRYALRHARQVGAPNVEKIDRREIYRRDGGRCHLCGKPAGDDYHLDHLVPLSKGGDHTKVNLRVAHPHCNLVRHDGRVPAQLLLIG